MDDVAKSADQLAARATTLRASLRDRRPCDPVTNADLAGVVELVELLACDVADLAGKRRMWRPWPARGGRQDGER